MKSDHLERSPWIGHCSAILPILSLAIYISIQLYRTVSEPRWLPGTVCATTERVLGGGPYYEAPNGLCAPTLPYPPGMLLTHHFFTHATGLDSNRACRLLGSSSLVVFSLLAILVSVRLGVQLSFAIASFVLISLLLKASYAYQSCFDFMGDSILLSCALGIILLAKSIERLDLSAMALIPALLLTAFAFKAQAASLYFGVLLFTAFHYTMDLRSKLWMIAMLTLSVLLGVCFLWSIPSCWESAVVAMQRHPLDFRKLRSEGLNSIHFIWPFVFFPLALSITRLMAASSFRGLLSIFRQQPAGILMCCCLIPSYAGIQSLALVKAGGGAYNLDFVLMLATPFVILGAYRCLRHRRIFVVLVSLFGALGFCQASVASLRSIPALTRSMDREKEYLSAMHSNAKVLGFATDYSLIRDSGLTMETDFITVWHYSAGGFNVNAAIAAVKSQYYDLVLLGDSITDEPEATEHSAFELLVYEFYAPVVDAGMPQSLHGRLLMRRSPLLHNH